MHTRNPVMPLILIVLAVFLGACSDGDSTAPGTSANLGTDPSLVPGTWDLTGISSESSMGTFNVPASEIAEDPLVYVFDADGTAMAIYQGSNSGFTWSVNGATLVATGGSFANTYTFGVSSTTLTLEFDVQDDVVYHITHTFTRRTG